MGRIPGRDPSDHSAEIKPRWAVELLLSFYVAATEECSDDYLAFLESNLTASANFARTEIAYIVGYTRRIGVRQNFRWVNDPKQGWVAEGEDCYSLRQRGSDFRFDIFHEFMTDIQGGPA